MTSHARRRRPALRRTIAPLALSLFAAAGFALELPPVFADRMVLQAGRPVPVWGTAKPGAEIAVRFAGQEKRAKADATGRWMVGLDAMGVAVSGAVLTVRGDFESQTPALTLHDVVVGEVWLCTGQSNMRFMLKQAAGGADAVRTSDNRQLRLLNFTGTLRRGVPAADYFHTAGWQFSSPQSAADFSAVAWFFGQKLQRELRVPVGLILNAVGGAPIEAFLPEETIAGDVELATRCGAWLENPRYPGWCRARATQELAKLPGTTFHPFAPSALHRAGMAPLQPFGIRGVLWYQGESNATDTPESPALDPAPYAKMFRLLAGAWRRAWSDPRLPVLFVELPPLNRDWGRFRAMQAQLAAGIPDCGMVTTTDVGHPTDVHPPDKRPVGERLADLALTGVYGRAPGPGAAP